MALAARDVYLKAIAAHADAEEILAWLSIAPHPPSITYVVHGEPGASATLRDRIADELGWHAVVPRLGERVLV